MAHTRSHAWSSFFGWGLTLSGASLAFFGSLSLFLADATLGQLAAVAFASLMAFAIACANVAADVAVRALRRENGVAWDAFLLAGLTCVGFAIAANIGVHLGWELLTHGVAAGMKLPGDAQIDLAFYVLCAGKPLVTALISYARIFSEQDEMATKARRNAHAVELARAAPPVATDAAVAEAARTARLAAAGVPDIGPSGAARQMSERPTEAETHDAARRLIARGVTPSNRTLAAELGVARSRIERGPQTWRQLVQAPQGDLLAVGG